MSKIVDGLTRFTERIVWGIVLIEFCFPMRFLQQPLSVARMPLGIHGAYEDRLLAPHSLSRFGAFS